MAVLGFSGSAVSGFDIHVRSAMTVLLHACFGLGLSGLRSCMIWGTFFGRATGKHQTVSPFYGLRFRV